MIRKILPLLALALLWLGGNVSAQTDSGYTDLGRIKLKEDFTQRITIKGEDLEKMPFSSLHEAIDVYLYGTFSDRTSLVYVVDGMLLNDVNTYSVYDIESVTLVQSALSQVSGAASGKQLVLITTRTNDRRKNGITVAASDALINSRQANSTKNIDALSSPDFFQQYYLSAVHHSGNISFGASGSFLRDVSPVEKNEALISPSSPYHFNRFRLNAWLNARLGQKTELSVKMNAAAEPRSVQSRSINSFGTYDEKSTGRELSLYPSADLITKLSGSLVNQFSGAFFSAYHKDKMHTLSRQEPPFSQNTPSSETNENSDIKEQMLRFKDDIRYSKKLGNWQIEPALNITYIHVKNSVTQSRIVTYSSAPSGPPGIAAENYWTTASGNLFLATPSLSLYLKNFLALQGGVQLNTDVFSIFKTHTNKIFPFASASVDLVRMIKQEAPVSLKLFGSYAKRSIWEENVYGLRDLESGFNAIGNNSIPVPIQGNSYSPANNMRWADDGSHTWQAGLNLSLFNEHLQIGYNYQDTRSVEGLQFVSPNGFYIVDADVRSYIHRVGITAEVTGGRYFSWRTGPDISVLSSEIIKIAGQGQPSGLKEDKQWRGGWYNHFRYKKIAAGFNTLYCFNQPVQKLNANPPVYATKNYNTFLVQHIYLGYQLTSAKYGAWEIYASARNLLQSKEFELATGQRKYYGLGVKAGL